MLFYEWSCVGTECQLSTDSDVVNLVFGFAIRRNPCCFMNGLVWEQSASNDQIIKGAKFGGRVLHSHFALRYRGFP